MDPYSNQFSFNSIQFLFNSIQFWFYSVDDCDHMRKNSCGKSQKMTRTTHFETKQQRLMTVCCFWSLHHVAPWATATTASPGRICSHLFPRSSILRFGPVRLGALLADRAPAVLVPSFVYGERMLCENWQGTRWEELTGSGGRGRRHHRRLVKWAKFTLGHKTAKPFISWYWENNLRWLKVLYCTSH